MTLKTKFLVLAFISCALLGTSARAQTINAATCAESDVQSALNKATSGSIVVIPAGTCIWTTAIYFNAPPNFTLQGQTVCTGSGAPSVNNLSCTDNTVIVDGIPRGGSNGDPPLLQFNTNTAGTFRVTGLTIAWGGGIATDNGCLRFVGNSQQFRVDHVHFKLIANLSFVHGGNLAGVMDHVLGDGSTGSGWRDYGDTSTNGDSNWAAPTGLGSSNFIFFEDNTFNTFGNDCQQGGRWVVRYNTFNNNGLQTHPTGGAGRARGCRAWEIYQNAFLNPVTNHFNVFFMSAGTGVIWGNNAPSGISNFVTMHSMRRDSTTYGEAATPNGWGYCGTSFTGTGSNWDQNTSSSTGYHCMDQPGQGMGDLLTGNFPNVKNTATGCTASSACASPRQALEPVYEWLDKWSGPSGGSFWAAYEPDVLFNNVDYYLWCDPSSPSGCTSFNGTAGVGTGTLASRPSTCTSMVGYWATDTNTLYQCSATNTWSAFYTPYTYPHPLTQASGPPPAAPLGVSVTSVQ